MLSYLSILINGEQKELLFPYQTIDDYLPEKRLFFGKNTIHFELFDRTAPVLAGVSEIGTEYEFPILHDLATDMTALTNHYKNNVKSIRSEAASLEHVFLKLTGNKQ